MFGSHERFLTYRYHHLVNTNRAKRGDKTEIRTQQYIQLNTRVKESQQTQYQALTLSSIDKYLSGNLHRVRGPTAIKEESKVANLELVDHQACSLLQYINVIINLLIMRYFFNKMRLKIITANIFS